MILEKQDTKTQSRDILGCKYVGRFLSVPLIDAWRVSIYHSYVHLLTAMDILYACIVFVCITARNQTKIIRQQLYNNCSVCFKNCPKCIHCNTLCF